MKNHSKALLHIGFRGLEQVRIIISYTNSIYQEMETKNMEKFKYAGKKMKINKPIMIPGQVFVAGEIVEVEDYWINVGGKSWMLCDGNPACCIYGFRAGITGLPTDNNVVYAKSKENLGHLFHVSELEPVDDEAV